MDEAYIVVLLITLDLWVDYELAIEALARGKCRVPVIGAARPLQGRAQQ